MEYIQLKQRQYGRASAIVASAVLIIVAVLAAWYFIIKAVPDSTRGTPAQRDTKTPRNTSQPVPDPTLKKGPSPSGVAPDGNNSLLSQ